MNFLDQCKAAHARLAEAVTSEENCVAYRSSDDGERDGAYLKYLCRSRLRMEQMIQSRGRLYAASDFSTYETKSKEQREVVRALKEYAKDFPNRLAAGQNVVIAGPSGTGKDHLLMALSKEIFTEHGVPSFWAQGVELLNDIRNSEFGRTERTTWNDDSRDMYHDERDDICERVALANRVLFRSDRPIENVSPILWLSDALPPSGPLTEYQQTTLFGLIDNRYSNVLPTWLTLNVAGKDEWISRMGAQTVDRLRDRSLLLTCDWPSYRKPANKPSVVAKADFPWNLPPIAVPPESIKQHYLYDFPYPFGWKANTKGKPTDAKV